MITYEYPFNERVRTLLRLEDLFDKTSYFIQQQGSREHHAVLLTLFEILEVASRADLKMDLIQELERQRQSLLVFRNNPDISEEALSGALYEIEQSSAALLGMTGKIGQYLREVVEQARSDGYSQTMFGRRRYFPELESEVRQVRDMAERAALNAPIQGSAADIFKIAMIAVQAALLEGDFASRMVLQVHDELLLEIAPGEAERIRNLVADAMGGAVAMSVPLDVAVGEGRSWRAAAH